MLFLGIAINSVVISGYRVWSIVNGQLISFSEKKIMGLSGFNQVLQSRSRCSTPHSHCLEDDKDLNVELQISEQSRRRPSGGSKVSSRHPVDDVTDESKILDDVGDGDIINGEGFIKNIHRTHVKFPKTSKSSSETNLNFNNNFDETHETFSRKANSRKSLPVGHVNLAFINEDDAKDPYLLI